MQLAWGWNEKPESEKHPKGHTWNFCPFLCEKGQKFKFAEFKLLGSELFVVAVLCYPGPWLGLVGWWGDQSFAPLSISLASPSLPPLTWAHLAQLSPLLLPPATARFWHCPQPLRLWHLHVFLRAPSVRLFEPGYMGMLQTRTTLNSFWSAETSLKKWGEKIKKRRQTCTL